MRLAIAISSSELVYPLGFWVCDGGILDRYEQALSLYLTQNVS